MSISCGTSSDTTGSTAGKLIVWPAASLCDLGRERPSTVTAAGLDQALGGGTRSDLLQRRQEPVETVAGGVVRHRQRVHQTSSPGGPPGGPCSAEAPWSSRPSPTSSSTTPTTMKQSARLNVGQCETWMKSVT